MNEAGVACLNGGAFGEYGEGYLRFSYANSLENLMQAVEQIRRVLEGGLQPARGFSPAFTRKATERG